MSLTSKQLAKINRLKREREMHEINLESITQSIQNKIDKINKKLFKLIVMEE